MRVVFCQRAPKMVGEAISREAPAVGSSLRRGVGIAALVLAAAGGLASCKSDIRKEAPSSGEPSAAAAAHGPVRGVSDGEVLVGMSAAFSGSARELGSRMKLGVETAFEVANEQGGVADRKVRLVALDDGYEGTRAGANMKELLGARGVFAVVGNVGTPTAQVAAPLAVADRTIIFGAFTGSNILRQEPPDRYVFNYRASYEEEASSMVHYLVDAKKVPPESIVVFAQRDGYGDAGFAGVAKALRGYGRAEPDIVRAGYERNTVDVDGAVRAVLTYHSAAEKLKLPVDAGWGSRFRHPVRAVIMIATYKPAARFIQKLKDKGLDALYLNVSFVGSNTLAEELKELGPSYAPGVIVTQVVPPYQSGGTGVLRYREALKRLHPDQQPDFVSLEGYVVGTLFVEGLRRTGRDLTTERLVDALEAIHDHDLGIGTVLSFGPSRHQASHKVWGTVLDAEGRFQSLDLE
jgi:ABC-type branched-subunit amino acid transport system substrate-binding protein